ESSRLMRDSSNAMRGTSSRSVAAMLVHRASRMPADGTRRRWRAMSRCSGAVKPGCNTSDALRGDSFVGLGDAAYKIVGGEGVQGSRRPGVQGRAGTRLHDADPSGSSLGPSTPWPLDPYSSRKLEGRMP